MLFSRLLNRGTRPFFFYPLPHHPSSNLNPLVNLDPDTPTHFNVIVLGTGLVESIVAAFVFPTPPRFASLLPRSHFADQQHDDDSALSKSGYSVLNLDQSPYYGAEWASLFLSELLTWTTTQPSSTVRWTSNATAEAAARKVGGRFSLSLRPTLLRAQGEALELLVRSKVASYLQFGMLGGVGFRTEGGEVERVPGSKADVFNHPSLSLVEKRRLTKFLLWVAGDSKLEESEQLKEDPSTSLRDLLQKSYSLSPRIADSLAYALCLCSTPSDAALPALERLRTFIRATGRYGPSPFLVGQYGGAGDLVGGFSRVCAVWGGGQILGRPIGALDLKPVVGDTVPALPLFSTATPTPSPSTTTLDEATALGIPVVLEPEKEPGKETIFTADWVVSSNSHLMALFPSSPPSTSTAKAVQAIIILSEPITFPAPTKMEEGEERNLPDSNLFVIPPQASGEDSLGAVTALQLGSSTFTCPTGYTVLNLFAPLLHPTTSTAEALLQPHLDYLLSLYPSSITDKEPVLSIFYATTSSSSSPSSATPLPPNLIVVKEPASLRQTSTLATALDEAVVIAEELFWKVVGEEGRKEGVEFFQRDPEAGGDETEGTM